MHIIPRVRRRARYRIVLHFDLDSEGKGVPIYWNLVEKGEEKALPMRASAVPLTHNSWTMGKAPAKTLATEIDVWMLKSAEGPAD